MNEFTGTFQIVSKQRNLTDLKNLVEMVFLTGSRERGQKKDRGGIIERTCARCFEVTGSELSYVLGEIHSRIEQSKILELTKDVMDLSYEIDIACFFSTATKTIAMSPEEVKSLHVLGTSITIAFYPVAEE